MAPKKRTRRQYATGRLAQARIKAGFSQVDAARELSLAHKQGLSAVERGQVMASPALMRRMSVLYGLAQADVLDLCTDAFSRGLLMRKHRARLSKLVALGKK